MLRRIKNNGFLFGIVGIGIGILIFGAAPPYAEAMAVLGAAFIIAGAVGIYMMLATDNVAKKLHERFNEQNTILKHIDERSGKQTEILKEIASSQKEIASSQKEIASTQKEMASTLKSIDSKIESKL